ncbi:hypothetical protein UT300005_14900 [Clostridium sp. CTA-5]
MEYTLTMTFLTSTGKKVNINIGGVKSELTKEEASSLMDTIIEKDIFFMNSGSLVSKDGAKLTERKVTKYELN